MSLQLFKGDKATGIWVKADKAHKDLPCGCHTEASVQESEEGSLGVTARRGDLVLYFDRNKSSKHECKEEDLPYRCPGPGFCDEINCDYCSHL